MRLTLIFACVLAARGATVARMACGGPGGTDPAGNVWAADSKAGGGAAWTVANQPALAAQPVPYQSLCYSSGTVPFSRTFTVPAGNYSVILKFLEPNKTAAGQRTFNVSINGGPVLIGLDVFSVAGGDLKPTDRTFQISAPGGFIQVTLAGILGNAVLSAVQIDSVPDVQPTGGGITVESGTLSAGVELVGDVSSIEIPIMTGIPGERRFLMVTVCSTVRFLGQPRVQVAIGRPGTNHFDLTGVSANLENASDNSNCWTAHPTIPQLIGPYDIVAFVEVFTVDGSGVSIPGKLSALTQGVMTWEVLYTSGKIGALNKTGRALVESVPVLECSGSFSHTDPWTGKVLSTSDCAGLLWAQIPGLDIVGAPMIPGVVAGETWTRIR